MVAVKVGQKHATYWIHKALLEHHSDYFRSALRKCWKEGEEGQVILDDLQPAAFDVFVDWLYTKKVPEIDQQWLGRDVDEKLHQWEQRVCVLRLKVYVVADRLGVQELLETINNDYVNDNIGNWPWYGAVIYAFSNIPSGRRILEMMVASHCHHSGPNTEDTWKGQKELRDKLPLEFLLQIMTRYQQLRDDIGKYGHLLASDYHEHASNDERMMCALGAGEC
jgi:hypothetical protein